jgi:outer membrane protein assembly factor BamE
MPIAGIMFLRSNVRALPPQTRKVTVFFKGESLERIEADPLPSEAEFVASLIQGEKQAKCPCLR